MKTSKWNKEKVTEEAAKYPTRTAFFKGCQSAYKYANKMGFLDELFPDSTHLTDDDIIAEMKKYSTKKEFREKNHRVYQAAYVRGLLGLPREYGCDLKSKMHLVRIKLPLSEYNRIKVADRFQKELRKALQTPDRLIVVEPDNERDGCCVLSCELYQRTRLSDNDREEFTKKVKEIKI